MAETQFTVPQFVEKFMKAFRENGYEIYIVGGPVRDMILGRPVTNWDFASNATPEHVLEMFDTAKYENDFGTVIVPVRSEDTPDDEKHIFEVTPYRHEGSYSDSRHPDSVTWAQTIEEDVQRRDFTINALAFDGSEVLDIVGGQKDIEDKLMKAVGDPNKRFEEDALRMMRAIRFAAQLGFIIDHPTLEAIQKNASRIRDISWERIQDEFLKILGSPNPADGVLMLKSTGILPHIMPELQRCFGVEQKSPGRHHIYDVGTHLIESLRNCPSEDPITRFAALIHDIGKPETRAIDEETGITTFYNHEIVGAEIAKNIAERFRLSKYNRNKLVTLVRYHMFSVSEEQTDKAVRRFITKIGKENIESMLDLRTGDRVGSGVPPTSWRTDAFKERIVEVQKKPFEVRDLKIGGEDVMKELGIKPGPEIGRILGEIFELVADGDLKNERDVLLAKLHEYKN